MKLEGFREMICEGLVTDFEVAQRYNTLKQEAENWNFMHRFDSVKTKNPLEYILNGDALEFIKIHRRELYTRLTGKECEA